VELFERITGDKFYGAPYSDNIYERIETNVRNLLSRLL
jgi:hypothetical protein